MNKKSLTKNGAWYLIYNVLNILFPFLTGIYVARVLLPATIGIVAAAQNFATYFVILAFLGIPTYGMREISKIRDDKEKLNKLYSELFLINLISTVIFSLTYYIIILAIPGYHNNLLLYGLVGLAIIFNALNNTFLFDGLEEYKYISIRNIVFKIVSFVILVLFVKGEDDYLIFAMINVIGTAGNYILNILYSRKIVKFSFKNLNLRQHMKSILYLVMVNLAIEIYTLVDVTMLNIFSSEEHIAFYSYASKINKMLLQIVNTFTYVLVPRIAYHYHQKQFKEFNDLLTKALKLIVIVALPMIIGIQFVSQYLLTTLYGSAYISSAYCLNILSLTLLISPLGYLLGSRTLLVSGQEKKMIYAVFSGAIVNVIGNLILIPQFNEYGAATASIIGEICVCVVYLLLGRKIYSLNNYKVDILKIIIANFVMFLTLFFVSNLNMSSLMKLILEVTTAVISYISMLLVFKIDIVKQFVENILLKIKRKKGI